MGGGRKHDGRARLASSETRSATGKDGGNASTGCDCPGVARLCGGLDDSRGNARGPLGRGLLEPTKWKSIELWGAPLVQVPPTAELSLDPDALKPR